MSSPSAAAKPAPDALDAWQPHPRPFRSLTYQVTGRLARWLLGRYGRWKVVGLENVPASGAAVLAANHASILDPLLIGGAVFARRAVWCVAKSELWRRGWAAFWLDRCGAVPIRRTSADIRALRFLIDRLCRGEAVLVFPEGGRTSDGRLMPARPGLALLVRQSGAPVIPVAVVGSYEMLSRHHRRPHRVPITVAVGAPLEFPGADGRAEISETVMRAISDLIAAHSPPSGSPDGHRSR